MEAQTGNARPERPIAPLGHVLTVNVGQAREIEWLGRNWTTAIWKSPVHGRVGLHGVNLVGDDQADREVHGGDDKAVYAYAREDSQWWETVLGKPVEPGSFGENLTLEAVSVSEAVVGEHWEIGSVVLEVSQPRIPCFKLGARMGDQHFPQRFAEADRPGAYLRILREGEVGEGDDVRIVHRPAHGVTVAEVARVYHHDHSSVERLLSAPELAASWRDWAEKVIESIRG